MTSILILASRRLGRGHILLLLICCILGALIGAILLNPMLGNSEAIGIVSIGTLKTKDPVVPLEEAASLATRMTALKFAVSVGQSLSDPTAADDLLAPVYGGRGELKVRALRDNFQVEVRVRNASETIALQRLTAVMNEILAQHTRIADNLIDFNITQREHYRELYAEAQKLEARVSTELSASSDRGVEFSALVAAKTNAVQQEAAIAAVLIQLEQATKEPYFTRSQVIAGPSTLRPLLRSPWQTGALGALAGFALGLMLIQIRRAIV